MARTPRNAPVNLTDAFALAAACPADRRFEMWQDIDESTFWLRVMRTGSKSWLVNSRDAGQKAFGTPGDMRAAKARSEAQDLLTKLKAGGIVRHEKMTLRRALALFPRTHVVAKSYLEGITTTLTTYGGEFLDKPMEGITREEAVAACEKAWGRSPRQGDLLKIYANRLYKNEGLKSPWAGIKDRYKGSDSPPYSMAVDKWAAVFDGIDELKLHTSRVAILTSIFTGFRPEAVCCMEWRHLRLDKGNAAYYIALNAPGFKAGRSWWYPLPEFLAEILRKRQERFGAYSEWVFFSPFDSAKHITNYREAVLSLRTKVGIPDLQPYHLRDTRGTYVEKFFGNNYITQRLLNHRPDFTPDAWLVKGEAIKTSKSTGKYVDTQPEDMRDFCERYANILLELAGVKPMTDSVRKVFIENKAIALIERIEEVPDDFGRSE